MSVGYSGTPLARKLGIRPGALVTLLQAPAHIEELVGPLDEGTTLRTDLRSRAPHDVIVLFVRSGSELRKHFDRARAKLAVDGGLWVAWPKLSSLLAGELRDSSVRAHGLASGLVDNKVCAIDEDWSGLRFVVRRVDRSP